MRKTLNLVGQRFVRLFVLKKISPEGQKSFFLCRCDCGKEKIIRGSSLTFGNTKSCGCLQKDITSKRNTTHGLRRTPAYESYRAAQERCINRKHQDYLDYGGRGIEFKFVSFEQFHEKLGPRPPNHSLDRIDVNGHYEPSNCRWATNKQQAQNRRTRSAARWQEELLVAYAKEVMGVL